ncbi:myelin-oligodendrocyte glycoprotein-like isoform X2 [Thunnus thynnus]|uniref:myelin-oligodendrocyte glycoprotein-like isoform X2 n=1 Tax=Thunnus thynnus TaxID=8237 RepID=UPI0035281449
MKLIQVMLLSFSLVVQATGEFVVIGSHEPIEVVVGDDVILPCQVKSKDNVTQQTVPFYVTNLTVEWRLNKTKVHVYRSRADYPFSQDQRFKDRTSLFLEEMAHGNISLKLTNVTQNDAGSYTCIVPKLQFKKGNVTLIVEPRTTKDEKQKIDRPDPVLPGQDAGIVIGIIATIIVIVVVIVVIYLSHQRCPTLRSGTQAHQEDNQQAIPLNHVGNTNDTNAL